MLFRFVSGARPTREEANANAINMSMWETIVGTVVEVRRRSMKFWPSEDANVT
jgi:hypothetical protein